MFSKNDLKQFDSRNILLDTIEQQIKNFEKGFPFAQLSRPATLGDGLTQLSLKTTDRLVDYYDQRMSYIKVVKFVPASGAASRMFKALFEYLEEAGKKDHIELLHANKGFNSPFNFIQNLKKFAFYTDLKQTLIKQGHDPEEVISNNDYVKIIDHLVNEKGLDYGNLPKGLLKFHSYDSNDRVSLEEHLVEAATYTSKKGDTAYIHFTVSPEHMEKFKQKVEEVIPYYANLFKVTFDVSFSIQKPSTDTIAVDMNNQPFRETDDTILFRPGGHGALIENLNEIDADLIFVKNIDNIVPDRLKPETIKYKKAIGGLLLELQQQCFSYLEILDENKLSSSLILEIEEFAKNKVNIDLPKNFHTLSQTKKQNLLFQLLNRPIRVCGMVRNEGEPGGGPFWVKNSSGQVSLQIVESSQIDMGNEEQKKHLNAATHFNPVDLVCGTKDYKGNAFDLRKFIDPETGFISIKSKNGKNLKAQELPGLWNGAMANWITLFVEVPIITFNPVKTINDLLREQHQEG